MGKFGWALSVSSMVVSAQAATAQTAAEVQIQREKLEQQVNGLRQEEERLRRIEQNCAEVVKLGGNCSAAPPAAVAAGAGAKASPPADQLNLAPAKEAAAAKQAAAADAAATSTAIQDLKKAEATRKFGGLELGVGLSFTMDVGNRDRVTEAELVNNIVRIKNADNSRARIMLESHYFFKPASRFFGLPKDMWGVGPFVAIQAGTDEIIEAIGLGVMIGFRRSEDESSSFNLGVGFVVDPNVKVLGDGILRDMPLPAGETEIRLKEDSQSGVMVIASFTF